MHYLLPKFLRSGRTSPSCSKRCNYMKQEVLSKRIQANLVKKYTKSGHTGYTSPPISQDRHTNSCAYNQEAFQNIITVQILHFSNFFLIETLVYIHLQA